MQRILTVWQSLPKAGAIPGLMSKAGTYRFTFIQK
jgi:hypothetical protein